MNGPFAPRSRWRSCYLFVGTPGSAAPPADMEAVIQEYGADHSSVMGFYNLPWSIARFDRAERLQHDWQSRLAGIEFDRLDQPGRVDFVLLRTKLAEELDDQSLNRRRLAEMADLIPFRDEINALEESRWRLESFDPEAAAARLSRLPDQVKQLRERIEKGKKASCPGEEGDLRRNRPPRRRPRPRRKSRPL